MSSRNLPAVLCFHQFAMIWTCTYLHFSNMSPQGRRSQKSSDNCEGETNQQIFVFCCAVPTSYTCILCAGTCILCILYMYSLHVFSTCILYMYTCIHVCIHVYMYTCILCAGTCILCIHVFSVPVSTWSTVQNFYRAHFVRGNCGVALQNVYRGKRLICLNVATA